MNKAEEYARKYLSREIQEIEKSERLNQLKILSIYEKAAIFKYTHDGFKTINELLRKSSGKHNLELGKIIDTSLSKLNNYTGLVYRCATLTKTELDIYFEAKNLDKPITEYAFISTSKSKFTAYLFGKNTIFAIYSRTGKDIEKIAKFGSYHPQNEKEVLFKAGRSFNILEIITEGSFKLIKMEER